VPAHTETGDSSSFAVIISAVLGIDIVDQLFAHISFIAVGRIDGAIPIPTVQAVGTYDDHIEIRSHLSQIGFCIGGPRIVNILHNRGADRLPGIFSVYFGYSWQAG
jgi:hypothetical protein